MQLAKEQKLEEDAIRKKTMIRLFGRFQILLVNEISLYKVHTELLNAMKIFQISAGVPAQIVAEHPKHCIILRRTKTKIKKWYTKTLEEVGFSISYGCFMMHSPLLGRILSKSSESFDINRIHPIEN